VVRERWDNRSLFILRDALKRIDPILADAEKPTGLIAELPSYSFKEIKDGATVRDEPAADSDDHACDALRYLCLFLDDNDWRPIAEVDHSFKAGTFGAKLGHADVVDDVEQMMLELYPPRR
jgi:hypothetical protein